MTSMKPLVSPPAGVASLSMPLVAIIEGDSPFDLIRKILEDDGIRTLAATRADLARLAAAHNPDLIILPSTVADLPMSGVYIERRDTEPTKETPLMLVPRRTGVVPSKGAR